MVTRPPSAPSRSRRSDIAGSTRLLETRKRSSLESGRLIAIVDAGPLYAVADADDLDHARCRQVLEREDLQLVFPALVIAEAAYLIGSRLGAMAESAFIRSLARFEVESPAPEDWDRIAGLVERYADFPLGASDASVAVLADRLGADTIVTLDRRHFAALRSEAGASYRLLPD